jgi:hypothetical protein
VLLLPIPINLLKYFASNQVKLPSPNGFRPVLRCGVVSTSIHNIYIYISLSISNAFTGVGLQKYSANDPQYPPYSSAKECLKPVKIA